MVAKKPSINPGTGLGAKSLIDAPLNVEVSKSFLEYSMSVVYSRALPSIIDGLKPVQRRILFSMQEEGFTADKNFVKAAKPVSSCMGNYHPHGDSSIYMALVKLAQPFYLNVPLVEGYGNFGDVTGSGPAASRYTECKLSKEATLLLSELRERTVPMRSNYSDDREEPEYLPVQFPNLLINGNFGIAVGFASNFAQHNGEESINAAKYLLKHPNATVEQLMKYIPGPDFPTGGQIIGTDGIMSAYTTGQGIIKIRGAYTIVSTGRGKNEIVFTELPYGAKTETIITKIKEGLKAGKLTGIADAQDLTDHANGLKFVVEVKAGVNPKAVVNELFRLTPLEESFGINNTCLVDGEPRTVGLIQILQAFLDHRVDVVTKRSQFLKDKKDAQVHLLNGLLRALADIDAVIKIIRGSVDIPTAHAQLMKKFKIDELQATNILELQLRRLTKLDQIELDKRKADLLAELAELNAILGDEDKLKEVINKELDAVKKILNQPRRSVIANGALAEHLEAAKEAANSVNLEVEDTPAVIGVYADGSVKRVDKNDFGAVKALRTGGKVNAVVDVIPARTRGKVILVTNKGKGYRVDVLHINDKGLTKGSSLASFDKDERVIAVAPVEDENLKAGVGMFFATKNGTVKITTPDYPVRSDDFEMITVEPGDEIVTARWVEDAVGAEVALMSTDTSLLKFDAAKLRPQGRSGAGVAGIKLADGQHVLAASFVKASEVEDAEVFTYTGMTLKRTPYKLYPAKGRATGGVRSMKLLKGETELVLGHVGVNMVLIDIDGNGLELPKVDNRRDGSGVKTSDLPATVGRG